MLMPELALPLELPTNLREVAQCPEKACTIGWIDEIRLGASSTDRSEML